MNAKRLLRRLRAAGFTLEVDGFNLVIYPAEDVTEWVAGLVRERKSELLDLLEVGVEFEEHPPCADCGDPLPLGGVRCPSCRDRLDAPACASCGAEVPVPRLSAVCSLCSLEAARLAAEEPDPPPEEDQGPEPGTCRECGTDEIGPSAEICGSCRRERREEP